MDDSGDGKLEAEELQCGFSNIFKGTGEKDNKNRYIEREWNKSELNAIISKVDRDANGYLDYKDFLMASIDLSKDAFLKYCERAFERFFQNNEERTMSMSDLYDILCKENVFPRSFIQVILQLFDEDGSDSISF